VMVALFTNGGNVMAALFPPAETEAAIDREGPDVEVFVWKAFPEGTIVRLCDSMSRQG